MTRVTQAEQPPGKAEALQAKIEEVEYITQLEELVNLVRPLFDKMLKGTALNNKELLVAERLSGAMGGV